MISRNQEQLFYHLFNAMNNHFWYEIMITASNTGDLKSITFRTKTDTSDILKANSNSKSFLWQYMLF